MSNEITAGSTGDDFASLMSKLSTVKPSGTGRAKGPYRSYIDKFVASEKKFVEWSGEELVLQPEFTPKKGLEVAQATLNNYVILARNARVPAIWYIKDIAAAKFYLINPEALSDQEKEELIENNGDKIKGRLEAELTA